MTEESEGCRYQNMAWHKAPCSACITELPPISDELEIAKEAAWLEIDPKRLMSRADPANVGATVVQRHFFVKGWMARKDTAA